MYNNGNSSKNVTGASVVDGTMESADYPDNGLSGDKIDGGIISNFQSTGIDDNATSTAITIDANEKVFMGGSNLILGDGTSVTSFNLLRNSANYIAATNAAGYLVFRTGGSNERMRILSSGGITFNGDTTSANALDDYEEGAFTATLKGSTTDPTVAVTTNGYYTKVGDTVTVQGKFSNKDVTGAAGNISISGLPFTASASAISAGSVWGNRSSDTNMVASTVVSSASISVFDGIGNSVTWATAGASTYWGFGITYKV